MTNLLKSGKISKYSDLEIMQIAIRLAKRAAKLDEVPIAAIVAKDGIIISKGINLTRTLNDPTSHAEMIAIKRACKAIGNFRLEDCDLFTTLEPCIMCTGAIIEARPKRLVIAAGDSKRGACELLNSPASNHKIKIEKGLLQKASSKILSDFFKNKRRK
ncbi:MAG: nucleoside deaminase [Firmicutes bacterium]|nr:nucleoside deaminase [Bacillota bacterium]